MQYKPLLCFIQILFFFPFVCLCQLEIDFKLLYPQAEVKLLANISKFIGKVKTLLEEDTGYGDEGISIKKCRKKGFCSEEYLNATVLRFHDNVSEIVAVI